MAAFTNAHSSPQYDRMTGAAKADPLDGGGVQKVVELTYTQPTGDDGTGLINLGVLPAGIIRVYPDNSRLVTTQFGASATISIGWAAYVDNLGATQSASAAGFHSVGAAGAGALDVALALPAAGVKEFNSRDGVVVTATIASGNIEAADTIWLKFELTVVG